MAREGTSIPTPMSDKRDPVDVRSGLAEELVSFLSPGSLEAEQYRTLRHAVERLHRDSSCQVFAITSAGPGEGKTITTLNLAGSLAQSPDARVLVICGDLHRASLTEYLGLAHVRAPGLAEALSTEGCGLAQAVRRLDS